MQRPRTSLDRSGFLAATRHVRWAEQSPRLARPAKRLLWALTALEEVGDIKELCSTMSGCSSEEAQSFDWESQSGLESNSERDLGYLSERDSESTPAPKTEPAFTVIETADLETIQARLSSCNTASSSTSYPMPARPATHFLPPYMDLTRVILCTQELILQSLHRRIRPCNRSGA